MASAVLAEMAKYRGTNGVTFFNGNAKITEKSGICYIEDYAMTPDVAKYYREQYLPKLRFNTFTNGQGRMCMNVNDNEYTDLFAAGLLKAMFGNGKGYSVGGPIDTLAGYVEFIKQLAKHFDQVQKLVPELSSSSDDLLKSENLWPNISIENLLLLLGDIAEYRNPVKIPEGYTALVYALLVSAYPNYEDRFNFLENKSLFYVIIVVSVLSMAIGAFGGLAQKSIRRIMAFSAVMNAGFIVIGLLLPDYATEGTVQMGAMYYFLITYAIGSAGALTGIAYLAGKDDKNETLEDIQGRGRKRPYVAVATTVCLASLAGMPPVAGFLAKFTLFTDALSGGLGFVAAIAFGLSLVAAVFYLRIAFVLFMPLKAECECKCCCGKNTAFAYLLRFGVTLAAIALIVVGIFPKLALIV